MSVQESSHSLRSTWRRLVAHAHSPLGYVVVFGLLYLAAQGLVALATGGGLFEIYLELHADAASALLQAIGFGSWTAGHYVLLDTSGVEVVRGCDATQPIVLFVCAVLAFPGDWRRRLVAILLGTTALLLINLVRIASLVLIAVHAPDSYDLAHLGLWPPSILLIAFLLWVASIQRTKGSARS